MIARVGLIGHFPTSRHLRLWPESITARSLPLRSREIKAIRSKDEADGLLVDTFDKGLGMGLLDYYSLRDMRRFVKKCHERKLEAWIAGSIGKDELPSLWDAGVDVICIRGAACEPGTGPGRFGEVKTQLVKHLAATIPIDK